MREGLDATAEAETDVIEAENEPDLATMRRALTELERAKARVERDASRAADELRAQLVAQLLPVLDNIDRTIFAAGAAGSMTRGGAASEGGPAGSMTRGGAGAAAAHVQGMRLVREQLATVLARYGLERFDAKHQRFDPRIHDAINIVPVSHPAAHDVVVDQIEPGYRFGDRLLRPAKVVVGRHTPRYH